MRVSSENLISSRLSRCLGLFLHRSGEPDGPHSRVVLTGGWTRPALTAHIEEALACNAFWFSSVRCKRPFSWENLICSDFCCVHERMEQLCFLPTRLVDTDTLSTLPVFTGSVEEQGPSITACHFHTCVEGPYVHGVTLLTSVKICTSMSKMISIFIHTTIHTMQYSFIMSWQNAAQHKRSNIKYNTIQYINQSTESSINTSPCTKCAEWSCYHIFVDFGVSCLLWRLHLVCGLHHAQMSAWQGFTVPRRLLHTVAHC